MNDYYETTCCKRLAIEVLPESLPILQGMSDHLRFEDYEDLWDRYTKDELGEYPVVFFSGHRDKNGFGWLSNMAEGQTFDEFDPDVMDQVFGHSVCRVEPNKKKRSVLLPSSKLLGHNLHMAYFHTSACTSGKRFLTSD
eukprot:scaffold1513_cov164-Pinguiococcus_pyrenoidosus.AAC.6